MKLLRDERGQTAIEYSLLLAAVISFFFLAVTVLKPLMKKLADTMTKAIDGNLFTPGAFHRFRIGN